MKTIVKGLTAKQLGTIAWNNYLKKPFYLGECLERVNLLKCQKWSLMIDNPMVMNDGGVALFKGNCAQLDLTYAPRKGGVRGNLALNTDINLLTWFKAMYAECCLYTAVFLLVCERILIARQERGIYPN